MTKNNNNVYIPVIIKDIAKRAEKNNPLTNQNEKYMAVIQLEHIRDFCVEFLNNYNNKGLFKTKN